MLKKFTYNCMKGCYSNIANCVLWGLFLGISLILIEACQKDGTLQMPPQVTEARIKVISSRTDAAARFAVFIDNTTVGDSLVTNVETRKIVAKADGSQHLVVKEITTNTTLLDTMLVLAKPSCSLSVLEYDTTPGNSPLLFVGGAGSSEIPEDSAKLAFYLGDTAIPAPVDIYLYQANSLENTLDTVPVHIFRNVNNFSATDFVTVDMSSLYISYSILVKYSGTDELVPDINNNKGVEWDNYRSGVRINICARPGSGLKTNVHNIVRLLEQRSNYRGNCMIYFE